jgi:hypothetical protein
VKCPPTVIQNHIGGFATFINGIGASAVSSPMPSESDVEKAFYSNKPDSWLFATSGLE